ncbi:cell-cycle control medial ring component-domain-containing protein [Annulohypoxylon truncatum]|uniref:cell-cycle control medial ring component-domain-containing protein n=1 Tax=Annulohypoxylon truncatum TaxID=327061 RepID=UPI002008156D|nr:cell-cycle control medial ring component-domain-containing protein [Annulohypoxylon truncatum]KAI1210569.1 cell-cycle control medial ring component-domain-containing protein [Annulohypoxylon truncatum]
MTEVSFARSFLTALDSRPIKLSPDHVEDPKSYPARSAYILPKMPKTMSKTKPHAVAPGQERSFTVLVKSLRNPPLDVKLTSQTPNTSILDIKASVSKDSGIPVDKMKILYKKKPTPDSKVLKDLAGEDETSIEFSVMVMGGAAAIKSPPAHPDVAQGLSGGEVLETKEFWDDLKGFLLQRIRDETTAGELASTFQAAWKARS